MIPATLHGSVHCLNTTLHFDSLISASLAFGSGVLLQFVDISHIGYMAAIQSRTSENDNYDFSGQPETLTASHIVK
jgi:hypothetical protein